MTVWNVSNDGNLFGVGEGNLERVKVRKVIFWTTVV